MLVSIITFSRDVRQNNTYQNDIKQNAIQFNFQKKTF
jgi:hypothetical protein